MIKSIIMLIIISGLRLKLEYKMEDSEMMSEKMTAAGSFADVDDIYTAGLKKGDEQEHGSSLLCL